MVSGAARTNLSRSNTDQPIIMPCWSNTDQPINIADVHFHPLGYVVKHRSNVLDQHAVAMLASEGPVLSMLEIWEGAMGLKATTNQPRQGRARVGNVRLQVFFVANCDFMHNIDKVLPSCEGPRCSCGLIQISRFLNAVTAQTQCVLDAPQHG